MAPLLSLDAVSAQSGSKVLFRDLKLSIESGTRLGIIGPNGSGKSTLLRIMAGESEPESGRVFGERGALVVTVPQNDSFQGEHSIQDAFLSQVSDPSHDGVLQIRMEQTLTKFGFTDLDKPVQGLSGGWRKRLSLAVAFSQDPDVLLLDEPTNHLDLDGLIWLESLLNSSRVPWAMVSHDRYFLERTATQTLEIAPNYELGWFAGRWRYSEFVQRRQDFLEQENRRAASLANKARRELDWASRSPKARTGKAAYRMQQATALESEVATLRSRLHVDSVALSFSESSRETRELIKLIRASFSYGDDSPIFGQTNFIVRNRSCIGILGVNGQGKSTLLKVLGGRLSPSTGKVKHAPNLQIGYFDQLRSSLTSARTLRDVLGDGTDQVVYQGRSLHIIGWARRFSFREDQLNSPISSLSGGELARALLSRLVRIEADVLILDEPTNDLDIPMLELLENMILEFQGAVVIVSHDRYLLEEVCTDFLGFRGPGELSLYGSYAQWEKERTTLIAGAESHRTEKAVKPKRVRGPKLGYKERRELSNIEERILQVEAKRDEVLALASDPGSHTTVEESERIAGALRRAEQEVESLYSRWQMLDELAKSEE